MNKSVSRATLIISMALTALLTVFITLVAYSGIQGFIGRLVNPLYMTEQEISHAVGDRADVFNKAVQLQNFIESYYYLPTDEIDFENGIYKGLFESLNDPYSVYMTTDEFTSFNESNQGAYGGIGIVVEPGKDNLITVVSPIEDTPGDAAGLTTGDKIIAVDGDEVFADQMDAAIKRMKGEPGTTVILSIYRTGQDVFDLEITRAKVSIKSVKSEMLAGTDNIGYLRITSFDNKVYGEFVEHYQALRDQGAQSLVIDLRDNPGGSLSQVVKISDYILAEQLVVYTETRAGERNDYKSDAAHIELPFVILVNQGSASASEILTGAVKDSQSGVIIGTTTFGKGIVQSVYPLSDGDGVKLTTAQYFTPNGTDIHGKGIAPDIVIEQADDYQEDDKSTDAQLQEAIKVLNE